MVEKIVIAIVSAALGGIGTLWLRWLRKDHVTEEIRRKELKVQLLANMRDRGVSQADLDAASAWAEGTGRQTEALSEENKLEQQEYKEIAAASTQAGMNNAQGRRLERLEIRVTAALEKLDGLVADDEDMKKALEASQTAWESYRDHMTEFAGAPWSGGTMQPFIEAGIRSRLTKDRAADLETEIANMEAR
jgi:uncharacterized protein YecT (DUF1311 family)